MRMDQHIIVIGGMNIDILATTNQPFQLEDSNPGHHVIDTGGVGFNIAYDLSLLYQKVSFFTVIGEDQFHNLLKDACEKQHIQVYSPYSNKSSLYIALFDDQGDLYGAVASMDAMEALNASFLKQYESMLKQADVIICDTNVSKDALSYIAQLQHPFKIIELVSAEKAKKIKGIQDGFHWIKGNHKEVNALFSTSSIAGSLQPEQAVIVTNQTKDAQFISKEQTRTYHIKTSTEVVNTSGAGDAFLVGCIDGYLKGKDILKQGHTMSLCALKSKNSKMLKECVTHEHQD